MFILPWMERKIKSETNYTRKTHPDRNLEKKRRCLTQLEAQPLQSEKNNQKLTEEITKDRAPRRISTRLIVKLDFDFES